MASKLMLVSLALLLTFGDSQNVTVEPPTDPSTDPPSTDPPSTDPPSTDPPTEPSTILDLVSLTVFALWYYSLLSAVHVSYRLL